MTEDGQLQVLALTALANAKRLAGDPRAARAALVSARHKLCSRSGDAHGEAEVLCIQASLAHEFGQFEHALESLDLAFRLYEQAKSPIGCARVLVKQGYVGGLIEPSRGVALSRRALDWLKSEREPFLQLCARHNLAWYLYEDGRPGEALTVFDQSRYLYSSFSGSWTQIRFGWLLGRLALALGEYGAAEEMLEDVTRTCGDLDYQEERVLSFIDLLEAYSLDGEFETAVRIATDVQADLESQDLHAEGRAMWLIFRNGLADHAEAGVAPDSALFRGITAYFHRAWRQPMRFGGPAAS